MVGGKKKKKTLQLAINANPAKLIRKMEVETDLNMNGDLSNTQHGGIKSRNFVKKKKKTIEPTSLLGKIVKMLDKKPGLSDC